MTKRTPLKKFQAWSQKALAEGKAVIEAEFADSEDMVRVMSDAALSYEKRLTRFKKWQSWPRVVLGLYEAELAIAQKGREEKGPPEYGRLEPSEEAADTVGDAVGLGRDRIHKLCNEGRLHEAEGLPPKPRISVAEFKRQLSAALSESDAAKFRQKFAEQKKQTLSGFEQRFSAAFSLT